FFPLPTYRNSLIFNKSSLAPALLLNSPQGGVIGANIKNIRKECEESYMHIKSMKRRLNMKGVIRLVLTVGLLVATASFAHAISLPTISYELTSNHCTVPADCGAPGTIFGTVTLTQSGLSDGTGTVNITVHLNSPYAFAKTGAADMQSFKFNATGVVVGDITV